MWGMRAYASSSSKIERPSRERDSFVSFIGLLDSVDSRISLFELFYIQGSY
ncbi:hypothetical protein LBBP_00902 [Leptospira borgpetersenii serovar Ballum]|uniref:Uncharacterized protein n=1 Tax=Leptospira borgpetersenii serovar Ballum TaxID=280505 RepID=A0A0S2INL1_LEPBO|nr:hypothetical protein LBBP_00902 [Leptospira borgpetersenii serovar Ballum]